VSLTEDVHERGSVVPSFQLRAGLSLDQVDAFHCGNRDEREFIEQESSRLEERLERFLYLLETVL